MKLKDLIIFNDLDKLFVKLYRGKKFDVNESDSSSITNDFLCSYFTLFKFFIHEY